MAQNIICVKTYHEIKSFENAQARYWRKLNFNTFLNRSLIFKLVKSIEVYDSFECHRSTGSFTSEPPITLEERACVINNCACRIKHCLTLNNEHLERVLLGSSWYFWFTCETKLQILQWYFPHLSINVISITHSFCCLNCAWSFCLKIMKHWC